MKVLALVIGNDKNVIKPLTNAINDANAMCDKFTLLGYDVVLKKDCKVTEMSDAIEEFIASLEESYDVGIFYFAGHAFQIESKNYLGDIECPLNEPRNCQFFAYPLQDLLDKLKRTNVDTKIIIIDACRTELPVNGRGISINNLAPVFAPKGTLIAFSTSPGEVAKDEGFEGHSIYTGAILKHIDEKHIPIEHFFKNVRTTVYNLSGGTQTSWEHTSLIGDFCFNRGQLVYSLTIPYDESVIKDYKYDCSDGTFVNNIIRDLKSLNYHYQNPAIRAFDKVTYDEISKDQQFIIGRNILQSCESAYNVSDFVSGLEMNIKRFSVDGENHVLNGILFEIYFDSNGEFRTPTFKSYRIDEIFGLQNNPLFKKSFQFIQDILVQYSDSLVYIPGISDKKVKIDIFAEEKQGSNFLGEVVRKQNIKSIKIGNKDITESFFSKYSGYKLNEESIKVSLSHFLTVPTNSLQIISPVSLDNAYYDE